MSSMKINIINQPENIDVFLDDCKIFDCNSDGSYCVDNLSFNIHKLKIVKKRSKITNLFPKLSSYKEGFYDNNKVSFLRLKYNLEEIIYEVTFSPKKELSLLELEFTDNRYSNYSGGFSQKTVVNLINNKGLDIQSITSCNLTPKKAFAFITSNLFFQTLVYCLVAILPFIALIDNIANPEYIEPRMYLPNKYAIPLFGAIVLVIFTIYICVLVRLIFETQKLMTNREKVNMKPKRIKTPH